VIPGIVAGVLAGLLIAEYGEIAPWIARMLVRWSAFRMYADVVRAQIRSEELAALIEERPGKVLKLMTALGYAGVAVGSLAARRVGAVFGWRHDGRDERFARELIERLRSLGELRRGIEPVAAALAARHATDAHRGTLTGAAVQMEVHARSGDLQAFLAADILFLRSLLEASGNSRLRALADEVTAMLTGRTRHHLMPAHPEATAVHWHTEVAEAVQAGDAAAAERAMRDIIDEATQMITESGR
jgi:hypothetical protein